MSIWIPIEQVTSIISKSINKKWYWTRNPQCKYINLRIDTRDGHCLIFNRDGEEIQIKDLEYQQRFKADKDES